MAFWVSITLASVGTASLALILVTYLCIARVRQGGHDTTTALPAISVLKPLKGTDRTLYENLVTFARQDYPSFELVLGCEDISDPALVVARQLQREFPDVSIVLVAGGKSIGLNPKVNNLKQLMSAAHHEYLLISDADVRVDPGYLDAMAGEITRPEVGLVCNVIGGTTERSLGAAFENLHLNTFITGALCGANVLADHTCVIGKSMFFRRKDFERLDGWNAVKDVLAEDYLVGRLFREAGLRVVLSPYVVTTVVARRRLKDFFRRHVRWGQMRRRIAPSAFLGEPLLLPSVWLSGSLALLLADGHLATKGEGWLGALAVSGLAIKILADDQVVRYVRGTPARPGILCLGVMKDWLILAAWAVAALKTTVEWRGNVFRIGADSRLYPLHRRTDSEPSVWASENRAS